MCLHLDRSRRMLTPVSSSRLQLRRLGAFFLAGTPAIVVVIMLAGLYAMDQVLIEGDLAHMEADAVVSATQLERLIEVHTALLESVQTLSGSRGESSWRSAFGKHLTHVGREPFAFRWMIVADDQGAVVLDSVLDGKLGVGANQVPAASFRIREMMDRAQTGTEIWARPSNDSNGQGLIAFVTPLVSQGKRTGIVIGVMDRSAIERSVGVQRNGLNMSVNRRLLAITAVPADTMVVGDTLLVVRDPRSARALAKQAVLVHLPGNVRWKVEIAHAVSGWPTRIAVWSVGLAALWALVLTLLREREQTRRVAERSQELERLSTELLHANRAKSEFLANVSHELRTPLNAIVGFVDLLRDGVYGDLAPRQTSPVERIAASATHLRHLVDQVLDLAKITAGRLEVQTDVVDLRAFVLAVASEMESLVTERGLTLSLGVGATLPRLRTDPTHLRQILVNLIGNAIKYTPQGTVAVRASIVDNHGEGQEREQTRTPMARREGLWVGIQIMDTGIGIAEADKERIFDEFEQVGAGPRGDSMQRGTGLGLSISRRLARLLGGEIAVESKVGRGSTFTLWLPVDPGEMGNNGADVSVRDAEQVSGEHT